MRADGSVHYHYAVALNKALHLSEYGFYGSNVKVCDVLIANWG